eukprot:563937-Pleurochrysis_carterae.AAC.2
MGAGMVTFAQCALGARSRKYTTVAYARGLEGRWADLEAAQCVHGSGGHDEVAHERDARGVARAKQAAAYPK